MGGNCSVAVKDKHLPNPAQLDVPLSTCQNTRYSPTWSFRCDNRTHIEVVMDSSPQISHHPNSGNEVKSEFLTEAERLSERAGPSTAFQLQKGETPIKNGSSRMATHDSAADRSNGSTASPKVGMDVVLLSITNPSQKVALKKVCSVDPSTEVGDEELGSNWCEVNVQIPIVWEERLIRSYGSFKIMGDATGALIAWSLSLPLVDHGENHF